MQEVIWWGVALAVLVVAGAVGWAWMQRRGRQAPTAPPPVVAPPPAAEPPAAVAVAVPPPPAQAVLKPPAPRAVAERPPVPATPVPPVSEPVVVPVPKAGAAERVVERPPVRPVLPRVTRFELRDARPEPVLVVERAAEAAWRDAAELASTPVQRELLGGLMLQAPQLDGAPAGEAATYAVRLRGATALAVARGEIAPPVLVAVPVGAIDTPSAADFSAALLALQAQRRPMPDLRAQVGETKTAAAGLHPKLVAQTEGRVKTLMQDLGRYLREAEENYAGAIRKPVFLDRVGQACRQAIAVWRGVHPALSAARSTLEAQTQAPRFGEVQLERTVTALRELQGQRRLLDVAARLLAGWQQLRMLLGERDGEVATTLGEAARELDGGLAADRTLAATLAACLERARPPDYVGKAEFNSHLAAAREMLDGLVKDSLAAASASLARAGAEFAAPPIDEPPMALLLQLDAQGRVAAVREPTSPAAR